MTQDPFVVQECVLLVLYPNTFLPDERPLPINMNRILQAPGKSPLAQPERSLWISYSSNHSSPFLVDSSGDPYQQFKFKSLRPLTDSLSIFSLLVNANSKLQNAKCQGNCPPLLMSYAVIIEAAVGAIFHVPKEVQNQDSLLVEPIPSHPSAHHSNITTPSLSTKHHGDLDSHQQQGSMDLDRQDSGGFGEDHFYPDDEEDDEPDTINGLTFPEMRTIIQQVSDGKISDQQRAEAAMLMLGMAGGEILLFICVPYSFLIPSIRQQISTGTLSIDRRSFVGRGSASSNHQMAVYSWGLHPCGSRKLDTHLCFYLPVPHIVPVFSAVGMYSFTNPSM